MKKLGLAALAACALLAAGSASATEFLYVYQQGTLTLSWEQSSDPTPISYSPGSETTVPVTDFKVDGIPVSDGSVQFNNASVGGGFEARGLDVTGPQLYFNGAPPYAEQRPFFLTGDFTGLFDITLGGGGTLMVTVAPEPATWALMLAGFASLGAALRSRRRFSPLL